MKVRLALAFILGACLLGIACSSDSDGQSEDAGRTLMEFVGRIDQAGKTFTFYGYITSLDGVDSALLFTDPSARSESTARITMRAQGTLEGKSNLENIFSLHVVGDISFYVNPEGGAKFTDSNSFASGTKITTGGTEIHNVITVIAPNQGLSQGSGVIDFNETKAVSLAGKDYQLTDEDATGRITMTGSGTRLEPIEPRATILVAGEIVRSR